MGLFGYSGKKKKVWAVENLEKRHIRLQRAFYLRNITECRIEGRPVIYTDESHIHLSHSEESGWVDSLSENLKTPTGKVKG
jgi:hypothetical protein